MANSAYRLHGKSDEGWRAGGFVVFGAFFSSLHSISLLLVEAIERGWERGAPYTTPHYPNITPRVHRAGGMNGSRFTKDS